jgi:hypothetical protein
MQTYEITPSMRTRALFYFMGWQGGTIHQLANETGLPAQTILDAPLKDGGHLDGFSAIRTCDRSWRYEKLRRQYLRQWQFFSGAIRGFWATGPLDGLNDRYPDHPIKTGLMRCIS